MGDLTEDAAGVDLGDYCRQIESHLCAKNGGHLIRIAGPSFTRVCGWASRGVPLKVAFRGIDRYVERYHAKGSRRRPVLIDFCEADVLDAFDEWRRAVGLAALAPSGGADSPAPSARLGSLPLHLDRVIARLTALRAGGRVPAELDRALEQASRELDLLRGGAKALRGEARAEALRRLAAIDRALLDAVRAAARPEELDTVTREAAEELGPFRSRMTAETFDSAVRAATDRLLRDRYGLPRVTYERN